MCACIYLWHYSESYVLKILWVGIFSRFFPGPRARGVVIVSTRGAESQRLSCRTVCIEVLLQFRRAVYQHEVAGKNRKNILTHGIKYVD